MGLLRTFAFSFLMCYGCFRENVRVYLAVKWESCIEIGVCVFQACAGIVVQLAVILIGVKWHLRINMLW